MQSNAANFSTVHISKLLITYNNATNTFWYQISQSQLPKCLIGMNVLLKLAKSIFVPEHLTTPSTVPSQHEWKWILKIHLVQVGFHLMKSEECSFTKI